MIDCSKTEYYLKEKQRMCKSFSGCDFCEFYKEEIIDCDAFAMENPQKAISIVQKWSDSHSQKTFLEDLLEKFPKAKKEAVVDNICPNALGYESESCCGYYIGNCTACWNRPYEEERK